MLKISIYVLLWFLAGYIPAFLFSWSVSLPLQPAQFGLLTLVVGLLLLSGITATERGRRLFPARGASHYEGPTGDEDGDPLIGCIWGLPGFLFGFGVIAWLVWLALGGF